MNTQVMERPRTLTETVTIKYVNEPKAKGKPATIRDAGGQYYSVWNMALLAQFRAAHEAAGGEFVCFVDYTVNDNGFRTAVAMRPVVQQAQQQRAPAPATPTNGKKSMDGSNYYRPTSPKDAERIFVAMGLKADIERGLCGPSAQDRIRCVNEWRQVWQETFGLDDPDNPLAAG